MAGRPRSDDVFAPTESAGDEQRGVRQSARLEAGQPQENQRALLSAGSSVVLRLQGSGHD